MYVETGSNAFLILQRALASPSASLRVRAVAMLAHADCALRLVWLEEALHDRDAEVRLTAAVVLPYVFEPDESCWPEREDPRFDRAVQLTFEGLGEPCPDRHSGRLQWEWEYVVEVWREDGLLIGVFVARTCSGDERHAATIGLGQAVLQSAGPFGEQFDSAHAGAFVTQKRRVKKHLGADPRWRDEFR